MDRLWAIKQNLDPFPDRILINYNLLAILRCTLYRCPYCRWPFKVAWAPRIVSLVAVKGIAGTVDRYFGMTQASGRK